MKATLPLGAALLALAALNAVPAKAAETPEARVIVKLKSASPLKQIQAAGRVQTLGQRIGIAAQLINQPTPDTQVMRASGISSEALAARLAQESDVAYAVPDRIKTIRALPNDPLLSHQWYLQAASSTQPAATGAQNAWNLTPGSASVVVAVVDTGVRFDHEDLVAKLLPGYDFIANDLLSGDSDTGRDADANDPGDYLSSADLANTALRTLCSNPASTHGSSWHGTQVAGIVGAETNNSRGIAGIGGATRILPVRALGKCGGYDSDIIAGMRWAAGLSVSGAPANPNPAKVINLSLAGSGSCSAAYADAIAEIRAAGVLIVAAAGNETGAVEEPANCAGVLAVAGIRHAGTKVGYSSYGSQVGISAPAGNCVNVGTGQPCLYPFINTINLGTTVPTSNGYTGINAVTIGTSFAVPLVSGSAALMLAANPALGEAELARRIKLTSNPFPTDSSLPACPTVTTDGQCNCTTATCGTGMLNTAAAVAAALDGNALNPTVVISLPDSPVKNTSLSLSSGSSSAAAGASLVSWHWVQLAGPATGSFGADTPSTTFTAPVAGDYILRLAITDSAGRTGVQDVTLSVLDAAPRSSGGGGGGAPDLTSLAGLATLALLAHRRRQHAHPAQP
ncbi:S8 family peptidase [Zoogloea sp. 1C4]|uniref:S8 family peptidase n=1 Tax=Zoogloea sp. 1C4 TaxID=2570190 RepID=UPI001291C998|nr:S8 family peptidase [Zoogloea sp. 1C4]